MYLADLRSGRDGRALSPPGASVHRSCWPRSPSPTPAADHRDRIAGELPHRWPPRCSVRTAPESARLAAQANRNPSGGTGPSSPAISARNSVTLTNGANDGTLAQGVRHVHFSSPAERDPGLSRQARRALFIPNRRPAVARATPTRRQFCVDLSSALGNLRFRHDHPMRRLRRATGSCISPVMGRADHASRPDGSLHWCHPGYRGSPTSGCVSRAGRRDAHASTRVHVRHPPRSSAWATRRSSSTRPISPRVTAMRRGSPHHAVVTSGSLSRRADRSRRVEQPPVCVSPISPLLRGCVIHT